MMRIAVDNVISLHWNDTILCMSKIVSIHIYFQFMYRTIHYQINLNVPTCNNTSDCMGKEVVCGLGLDMNLM